MSPSEYILVAASIAGIVLFLATSVSRPQALPSPEPQGTTRWKRFHLRPALLRGALSEAATVVAEEPKGLKLRALPRRGADPTRIDLETSHGDLRLRIQRRWRPFRWLYRVTLGGAETFQLVVPKKDPRKLSLVPVPPSEGYQLRGALRDREYEILRGGKIVALVSWQMPAGDDEPVEAPTDYIVETLKSEEAVPILAVALAVEVAMG